MTNITLQKQHRTLWHFIPGLALSAVITGVALWGGSIPAVAGAGFSALTLAILLGMVLGNTIYPHIWKSCDGGVLFAKQYLLRLGIILYGFRLTFSQIADVGISGIIIDVLTLSSTFLLACFLGQKVFGLDKHTSWLIGAGSSICGAAAVLATEPVVKAEASKVTVAVATVVIFGTVAIFLYPAIYPLMSQWFSPETFGIYIGSTVHEVAQVAAAGAAVNATVADVAVITKMIRVLLLAPFLLILPWLMRRFGAPAQAGKAVLPWFAVGFLAIVVVNSLVQLPPPLYQAVLTFDTFLLTIAMFALGLTTRWQSVREAGLKPLALAGMLALWLLLGGAALSYGAYWLFH